VVNDMPKMVDYVYTHTAQKPHFVGHSMVKKLASEFRALVQSAAYHGGLCFCRVQGTLVALAALSEGRLVDKMKSAALLTPVAYLAHMTTPLGILLAKAFVGEVRTQ
jgi:lysosomal acid lipase/cholesteryl ester hydrolase